MKLFVRLAALYNVGGGLALVTPGLLGLVGVVEPASNFWLWLPALLGSFGAVVLWLSSNDLATYGAFVIWNGVIRLVFVAVTFALDFPGSVGAFAAVLALGDLALALGCLIGLPRSLRRSAVDLLLNRPLSTVRP